MSTKLLALLNALSVVLVLSINFYSTSAGINGNTVGSLSDEYRNLFTPAGYAFAIWSLIFLGLVVSAIFQLLDAFRGKATEYIQEMGPWFFIANLLNATWVVVWLSEFTGLSVIVMLGLLISLLMITLRTNMERWDAPVSLMIRLWWPMCFYFGWISVAIIANIAAWLAKLGWEGGAIGEPSWTIIMILVAIALNVFMVLSRNMREFATVGIWALMAIYVRHSGSIDSIAMTALAGAGILSLVISWHAWKNRKTLPLLRSFF